MVVCMHLVCVDGKKLSSAKRDLTGRSGRLVSHVVDTQERQGGLRCLTAVDRLSSNEINEIGEMRGNRDALASISARGEGGAAGASRERKTNEKARQPNFTHSYLTCE